MEKNRNTTFGGATIWVVVGVRVINAVTVGSGQVTGIDEVLVGLTLIGCRRGRNVWQEDNQKETDTLNT